jgi:hypothetical protein
MMEQGDGAFDCSDAKPYGMLDNGEKADKRF